MPPLQVRKDFSAVDADGNVTISLDEFREYVEKMRLAATQRSVLDHVAELNAAYGQDKTPRGVWKQNIFVVLRCCHALIVVDVVLTGRSHRLR